MKMVVLELDRPGREAAVGRNIDLTLTFLGCSIRAPAEASAPLPADLEPVAKQLRAATQYKHVEVWDVIPMRIGPDPAEPRCGKPPRWRALGAV